MLAAFLITIAFMWFWGIYFFVAIAAGKKSARDNAKTLPKTN